MTAFRSRLASISCVLLVFRLLATEPTLSGQTTETAKDRPENIVFEKLENCYPMNSPIAVRYKYEVTRSTRYFSLDSQGMPFSRVSVTDQLGKRVPRADGTPGNPFHVSPSIPVRPGHAIELAFELTELFRFPQAGKYTLQIDYLERLVFDADFELVEMSESETFKTRASCVIPATFEHVHSGSVRPVDCRFTVQNGKSLNGTLVAMIRVDQPTGWAESDESRSIDFPPITQVDWRPIGVEAFEVDFQWRLWAVLNSGEQHALKVFDLRRNAVCTLIEWQPRELEINTLERVGYSNKPTPRIVVAGMKEGRQFTSYSRELEPFNAKPGGLDQ